RHFQEAELLIIMGADPLGGVDRSLFQSGIDVAQWNLLRHDAEPAQHLPRHTADPEFKALHVVERLDLLAEPAAHLRGRVAERDAQNAERAVEYVEQVEAAGMGDPGVNLERGAAERNGRDERESPLPAAASRRVGVAPLYRA